MCNGDIHMSRPKPEILLELVNKTNLEGSAATKLRKKVKSDLIEQGLWDQMINGTDRYVAAVRLPNGKYGIVNLKPDSINAFFRDIFMKMI